MRMYLNVLYSFKTETMENTKTFTEVFLATAFFIALIHSIFHLTFYGTGISGFYEQGVSGFSVGLFTLGDDAGESMQEASPLSLIMISVEWIMAAGAAAFLFIRRNLDVKREIAGINLDVYRAGRAAQTDLDVLYALLREKKNLHIETIASVFSIDSPTALKWAGILEQGRLATLVYPRFTGPVLTLI